MFRSPFVLVSLVAVVVLLALAGTAGASPRFITDTPAPGGDTAQPVASFVTDTLPPAVVPAHRRSSPFPETASPGAMPAPVPERWRGPREPRPEPHPLVRLGRGGEMRIGLLPPLEQPSEHAERASDRSAGHLTLVDGVERTPGQERVTSARKLIAASHS